MWTHLSLSFISNYHFNHFNKSIFKTDSFNITHFKSISYLDNPFSPNNLNLSTVLLLLNFSKKLFLENQLSYSFVLFPRSQSIVYRISIDLYVPLLII